MPDFGPPKLSDRVADPPPPKLSDRVADEPPVALSGPDLRAPPDPGTQFSERQLDNFSAEYEKTDRSLRGYVLAAPLPGVQPTQARAAIDLAKKVDTTPEFAARNYKDLTDGFQQEQLNLKLRGLPGLTAYAQQGPTEAAAVKDDVDNLGIIDFAVGRQKEGTTLTRPGSPASWIEDYLTGPKMLGPPNSAPGWEDIFRDPGSAPGWLQAWGKTAAEQVLTLKSFWDLKFGGGEHYEQIRRERTADAGVKIPGEGTPIGGRLLHAEGVVGNLAPYMIHPGVAFGMMYINGTAQTYEALRAHGYKHDEAAELSELVGFSSASVGLLTGGQLFGSILPRLTIRAIGDGVPGAMMRAVYDKPEFWKFLFDGFKNQAHALLMNTGMMLTETAITEAWDAHKNKRPFSYSSLGDTLDQAWKTSWDLLPLSIWAGARQAANRAQLYEEGGPFRGMMKAQAEQLDVEQRVFDEYERQGLALRSLKEAGDIHAAAEAVQRSKLMQENPQLGKDLIRSLLKPRKTQSVFIDPSALMNLPEAELSDLNIKNFAESLNSHGFAEVSLEDFLTTPSAPELAKDVAAGSDLMTPREAEKHSDPPPPIDLTRLMARRDFILMNEADTPARRERLDALNIAMRETAMRAQLSDEQWDRLGIPDKKIVVDMSEFSPPMADEEMIHALTHPEPGAPGFTKAEAIKHVKGLSLVPEEPAKPKPEQPMLGFRGKLSRERLRAWADDQVEDRTIGVLDSLAKQHEQQANAAGRRADALQEQATGDLGRSTRKAQTGVSAGVESGELGRGGIDSALAEDRITAREAKRLSRSEQNKAENKGVAAVKEEVKAGDKIKQVMRLEKIAKINDAMADAMRRARKEADSLEADVKAHRTAATREAAYAGGEATWEYATAHDAILAALGGKRTGWEAPDISDALLQMKQDGYPSTAEVVDERAINQLLQNPKELSDLTVPQARAVKLALDNLLAVAKAKATAKMEQGRVNFQELGDQIGKHLERMPFAPPGQRHWLDMSGALNFVQKLGGFKAKLQSELNQPYTIFAKMGPVGDYWWFEKFVPAAVREEQYHAEIEPKFRAIDEAFPKEIRETGEDIVPALPGAPAKMGRITRDGIWRLILHLGTESGIAKISKGLGVSPQALVQWVQANMAKSPEHVPIIMEKLIEPTWKVFNDLWSKYEPALRERGLPPPKTLDAAPFTVGGKTYSGGYGGRLRWLEERLRASADPESVSSLIGYDDAEPSAPKQHLQERTKAAGIPHLAWGGVPASIRAEAHHLAFDGFVTDTLGLLKTLRDNPAVVDKIGKHFLDQLWDPANQTSWLHVVGKGQIPDLPSLSAVKVISNLQGRAALSAFALNARVIAMQLSHIPAMMAGMDLPPAFAGAFVPERRAWAEANSAILRFRQNDFERKNTELTGQLTGVRPGEGWLAEGVPGVGAAQEQLNKFNWSIWKEMDGFLSHALWEMGLHKALMQGKSQPEAMRFADSIVQRGMPVQTIYEQSAFVRDRKMMGLLFLVRNFPNTLYNVQALESWNARAAGGSRIAQGVGSGVRYIGMVLAAEILGKGVFGGHMQSAQDDDKWIVANVARSLAYPVYMDAPAEGAVRLALGDRAGAKRSMERMTPASLKLAGSFLTNLGTAVWEDNEVATRAAMEALGVGTRMPIPKLYDWMKALIEEDDPVDAAASGAGYRRH